MKDTGYIVRVSSARMAGNWGGYVRIGLMEVEVVDGKPIYPKMISERAKGVVRIVDVWNKVFWGKGIRSHGRMAYDWACREADRLNSKM